MANPLVFSVGTTTISSSHSLKMTKLTGLANSATAVSVRISDLNGALLCPPVLVPAGANNEVTADFFSPVTIPGGTNLSVTNAIITVTGAGGVAYLSFR